MHTDWPLPFPCLTSPLSYQCFLELLPDKPHAFNPSLRICFWGNPPKAMKNTRSHEDIFIYITQGNPT